MLSLSAKVDGSAPSLDMDDSLIVMVGIGRVDASLSPDWVEKLESMKREAIPIVAVRGEPIPSVLLEAQQTPEVQELINALSTGHTPEYFVVWCALIASNLSIADTLLLINMIKPIDRRLTLRFHLIRHREALEMINRLKKLAIFTEPTKELLILDVNVPDLQAQLEQVSLYQESMKQSNEKELPDNGK